MFVPLERRRCVEQRLHDPPRLLDRVLACEVARVADNRGVKEHFVRRRAQAPDARERHLELDRAQSVRVRLLGVQPKPGTGRRADAEHELVLQRPVVEGDANDAAEEEAALLEPVKGSGRHHPRQVAGNAEHDEDIRPLPHHVRLSPTARHRTSHSATYRSATPILVRVRLFRILPMG